MGASCAGTACAKALGRGTPRVIKGRHRVGQGQDGEVMGRGPIIDILIAHSIFVPSEVGGPWMVLSQVFAVTQRKSQKHSLAAVRRAVEEGP